MTTDAFASDIILNRDNFIFKQLNYTGYGDRQEDEEASFGLAYMFKSTNKLTLWDTRIDLSHISLDEESPLKHL